MTERWSSSWKDTFVWYITLFQKELACIFVFLYWESLQSQHKRGGISQWVYICYLRRYQKLKFLSKLSDQNTCTNCLVVSRRCGAWILERCGLHGWLLSKEWVKKFSNRKFLIISSISVDIISKKSFFSRVHLYVAFSFVCCKAICFFRLLHTVW